MNEFVVESCVRPVEGGLLNVDESSLLATGGISTSGGSTVFNSWPSLLLGVESVSVTLDGKAV